jgi:CBS domain-containing protein
MNRTHTKQVARTFLDPIRTFGESTCASTLPEYTLVLAILVAGACLAYIAAGSNADSVLRIAARLMDGSSEGTSSGPETREVLKSPSVPSGRATVHLFSNSSWASQHVATLLGIGAWIATMAVGLVVLRIVRGRQESARVLQTGVVSDMPVLPTTSYDRLVEKRQQICRIVTRDAESSGRMRTLVCHLMSKHLATVLPGTPLTEAVARMTDQGIRHLLVCEKDGQLVGIISDRDVKNRSGATVADIMTTKPVVAARDMAVGPAITLMLSRNISCLPIVDGNQLCGVLTTTDIMLSCQCMLQVMEKISAGLCSKGNTSCNRISAAAREQDSTELISITA